MTGPARFPFGLVATDLDGTLLRADGTLSAYTAGVLADLEEAGVPVVFVTGRPLRWAREVFAHVAAHGLAVVSNGALVWDVAADEPLLTRGIDDDLLLAFGAALRAAVPGTTYGVETLGGLDLEPAFLERYPLPEGHVRAPLEELVGLRGPTLKLLARHEDLGPQEFWDLAREAAGATGLETTWSSSTTLVEVSAPGVTKASTLAGVAADLGVGPERVVAFGDMPNDVAMLTWAGRGLAVANAHASVLACADGVVGHHDEDGVAAALAGMLGA